MLHILNLIYSWPFIFGALVGFTLARLYELAHARWLDQHHPLPSGERRHAGHLSRMWLAGLITAATMGYVLLQAQHAHDDTVALNRAMARCNTEHYQALKARTDIADQDSRLSRVHRDLLDDLDGMSAEWLNTLLNPPPNIAVLPIADERRQSWGYGVTRAYFTRAADTRRRIADIEHQQDQLVADRAAHPLPELTCGH